MAGSTGADGDGMPQEPTVASILGVRGSLRFRSHGSTQKAHVVLRQIDLSEESGDEGDDPNVVYFSLFAQKRIEVKPGKEILLAVASPDGRFIDTPVIFAGSIVEPKSTEAVEPPTKPVVEPLPPKPAVYTMPPRMRKAWPGQNGDGQMGTGSFNIPPSRSTSYTSTGVQCEIAISSRAVETEPEPVRVLASSGVQAEELPRRMSSKDTQTEIPRISYQDGTTQTIQTVQTVDDEPVITVPPSPIADSPASPEPMKDDDDNENDEADSERERSLSPMELDSPLSSPTLSPVVVPTNPTSVSDDRAKSLSATPRAHSPPALTISTTDTSHSLATAEARISPLHLSPDSGDAPGLAITPEVIAFHKTFTPPVDRSNIQLPPAKSSSQTPKLSEKQPDTTTTPSSKRTRAVSPPGSLPSTSSTASVTPQSRASTDAGDRSASDADRNPAEPTRYVPKRKAVPNPFVSGGYLKEFASTAPPGIAKPSSPLPATSQSKEHQSTTVASDLKASSTLDVAPETPVPSSSVSSSRAGTPPASATLQTRPRSASPPVNVAASSSKVKVEDLPPNVPTESAESNADGTKAEAQTATPKAKAASSPYAFLTAQPYTIPYPSYMTYPTRLAPGSIPYVPARTMHPSVAHPYSQLPPGWQPYQQVNTNASKEKQEEEEPTPPRSPPPEPKTLAHISSGSFSNPLNIRPAKTASPAAQTSSPATPTTPALPKKPVVVGNGWPYNTRSHARAAAAATPNGKAQGASDSAGPSTPAQPKKGRRGGTPATATAAAASGAVPPTPAKQSALRSSVSDGASEGGSKGEEVDVEAVNSKSSASTPSSMSTSKTTTPVPATLPAVTPLAPSDPPASTVKPTATPTPVSAPTPTLSASAAPTPISVPASMAVPVPPTPAQAPGSSTTPLQNLTLPLQGYVHHHGALPPTMPFPSLSPNTGGMPPGIQSPYTTPLPSSTPHPQPLPPLSLNPSAIVPPSLPGAGPRPTSTPTSATTPSHPLPPKPQAFTGTAAGSYSPRRGVKRMVSPTPLVPDLKQQQKQGGFAFTLGDSIHSIRIKADGDPGVRLITFNSDGTQFAVTCYDKSVRIWNRRTRSEIAKLGHNMQVIAVAWMEHDSGVYTLGDNGILSSWTRNAQNKWQWSKILDVNAARQPKEVPSCFAYTKDKFAIGLPSEGVKIFAFMKGTWLPQRTITRHKVTTVKFVDDGDALVGGTEDGTLWHCEVPNGTLKALKIYTKAHIVSVDADPRGQLGLIALADGRCELVNIRLDANKGSVEQTYTAKDKNLPGPLMHGFAPSFTNNGTCVSFGSVRGCVLVWNKTSGEIQYGFKHNDEDELHVVSCFSTTANLAGLILTGTRNGQLTWFTPPPTDAGPPSTRKRAKV
ncbi:hypothetical protein EIP91_002628 [Steccherinum ochraceum]|uniref:Uncharacterized protein n=1 Tax=Steccherinum ochraceum TaxID=92696 RepID=A0A4R0S0P1_9APHY|nr:hypothetical protein EIP91_002628 [Steccherinum ochraceum]